MEDKQVKAMEVASRASKAYVVAISILCGVVVALTLLLYGAYTNSNQYATTLESNYQKSYYELVDNVNNSELKLSKVVSSKDDKYSQKLLAEISKNAQDAQNNLNNLPVSVNGVEESLSFVNQLGGYCDTLSKNVLKGEAISSEEKQTLSKMHEAVLNMKNALGEMSNEMWKGYSILSSSLSLNGDYNDFTVSLQSLKAKDIEYPTMIYDGPFSDSQIKKEIKGLEGNEVSMEEAQNKLIELLDLKKEQIEYKGEANSNFQTYDFEITGENKINIFAQVTKKGNKLLTLSSYGDTKVQNMGVEEATQKASEFIKKSGLDNLECVWSDIIGGDAYLNFAPIQQEVIIYPDLIKVKVDLETGKILGYEAKSYYTNSKDRTLENFAVSLESARAMVPEDFYIQTQKKSLAPIEFEEILCYEFKCIKNGDTYYFYVDSQEGQLVNILRVIQTSDGNKLM